MRLVHLHLKNFRNFQNLDFSLPSGFLVLVGPNGAGKSNLLEGIYYLGAGHSYRYHRDEVLVHQGTNFFAIHGKIQVGEITHVLEVFYQLETRQKIVRINKKQDLSERYTTYLPVVIFSPVDLLLLQGAPFLRRRFLDFVVIQVRPQHAADLRYYREVLNQRNTLLRQGFYSPTELQPWDEQLIQVGARILSRRLAVFSRLVELCRGFLTFLSGVNDLEGLYISRVVSPSLDPQKETVLRDFFAEALARTRFKEKLWKMTLVGPHRDDLCFCLHGHNVRFYCSQGEQRLLVLALKISQVIFLTEEQKTEPLLLLDDIFSELDEEYRKKVFDFFLTWNQVIATTTSSLGIKNQITSPVSLFNVEKNRVRPQMVTI